LPKTLHLRLTPRPRPGRERPQLQIKRLDATSMSLEHAQQLINYAIKHKLTVDFQLSNGLAFTLDPRHYRHIGVTFDVEEDAD